MRHILSVTLALSCVLTVVGFLASAQEPPMLNPHASNEVSVLMRAKLSSSQKIVEGLMAGDFAMIRKGADDLKKICDSAQWKPYEDQVATHYRDELRRIAIRLEMQAENQNLDGAAYMYMLATTNCISCHQYTRDVLRIADRRVPRGVVPIPVSVEESESYQVQPLYR